MLLGAEYVNVNNNGRKSRQTMLGQTETVKEAGFIRFKARILVPLSIALIALVVLIVTGFYYEKNREVTSEFEVTLQSVQSSFDTLLGARSARLLVALDMATSTDRLVETKGGQDRDNMRAIVQSVADSLRLTMDSLFVAVYGLDRKAIFRIPDQNRTTIVDDSLLLTLIAKSTSKVSGLVLTSDGEMTIRVATSINKNNASAGYLQIGQDINSLLQELYKIYGLHFFVAIKKSDIEQSNWQDQQKRLGRDYPWPQEGDRVFIAGTLKNVPAALADSTRDSPDTQYWPEFVQVVAASGRRKHQLGTLPIHDAIGREIGSLVVLKDIAAQAENIRDTTQYIALIGGATTILLFAFFYEILSRSERRIAAQREQLLSSGRLNPTTPHLNSELNAPSTKVDIGGDVRGVSTIATISERIDAGLRTAKQEGKSVGFILLEVSNLNDIVDTFGDEIADALLSQVTWRLREGLRNIDLISKSGFNEFGIVLPAVTLESAITSVQKIIGILNPSYIVGSVALDCRIVMGMALYPYHGSDVTSLFRRAEMAKRTAARNREHYAVFDSRPESSKQRQISLLTDLHRAVSNDQLALVCFPRVEFRSERINGVETLLRWKHNEIGYIPPKEIFDLAEKSGMSKGLTRWVVARALKQHAAWIRSAMEFNVAINVTASNVADPVFADEFRDLLRAVGVDPATITLELTERALTTDPQAMTAGLRRLHAIGVQLCIDDVGTGNSALPYLKTLPVSEIKIDESIIYTLLENTNNLAFVRSAIDLAHSLGITVCAEGIKNKDLWDVLRELRCDSGQGHYITQPSSYSAFECWLVNSKYGLGRKEVTCDWRDGN